MQSDVIDDVLLHYTMLEYLFSKKLLALSCSNHCWEDFRAAHQQYQTRSADSLKKIFWREIMPSIDNYKLMRPEMKEYFETNKFFIESAFEDIASGKYEPKKDVDYKIWTGDQVNIEEDIDLLRERFKNSLKQPKTYEGFFGLDPANELCDNHLLISTMAPPEDEDDEVDLVQTFKEALRTKEDGNCASFTREEILSRLSNPDIIANMENFKKLPSGIQNFMKQFPYFKDQLQHSNQALFDPEPAAESLNNDFTADSQISCNSSDKENTTRISMDIPSISSLSSTPLSEASNKAVVNRRLRSLASRSVEVQAKRDLAENQKPSCSRELPLKHGNRQMQTFMKSFAAKQKRRRDSRSPSSGSNQ